MIKLKLQLTDPELDIVTSNKLKDLEEMFSTSPTGSVSELRSVPECPIRRCSR